MKENIEVQDVIYGPIILTGTYGKIVQSKDFTRLKEITQTGTSKYKYEKLAQGTRYDHSIGAYHVMCQIIELLREKLGKYGICMTPEQMEIAKVAMLLHDIGHAAYSHTAERITGISHEQKTVDIILDEDTEINQILSQEYGKDFVGKVGDFLSDIYLNKGTNSTGILDQGGNLNAINLFKQLMSNNIDADRLDYLVRDSTLAGKLVKTDVKELIKNWEIVPHRDNLIAAVSEEYKELVEEPLSERIRNYRDVYYVMEAMVADKVIEDITKIVEQHPEEVENLSIAKGVKKFLTRSKEPFSNQEYMELTEVALNDAIGLLRQQTQNPMLQYICNIQKCVNDFTELKTDDSAEYIKDLLQKAIPELVEIKNMGLIIEERTINPYKENENEKESCYLITNRGIETLSEVGSNLNLNPTKKRVVAINPELIRLQLGINQEEFQNSYQKRIEEVMSLVTRPKDELEIRYLIKQSYIKGDLLDMIGEKYPIISSQTFLNQTKYYDNPDTYSLLDKRDTLGIRYGKEEDERRYKSKRIQYKKYIENGETEYIERRKMEQIGESTDIGSYTKFMEDQGIEEKSLDEIATLECYRRVITIDVHGVPIDISLNMTSGVHERLSNSCFCR